MRVNQGIALAGAVVFALWPVASPVWAGKDAVGSGPFFAPPALTESGKSGVSAEAQRVTEALNLARDFCAGLKDKAYAIDCLAAEMEALADSMSSNGELAPVKAALQDGARKLSGIVDRNQSASKPRAVAKSPSRSSPRPIRAVEDAKLDLAATEAIGVIEETGTILLRSSETSAEAASFVAISTAVTSNTVLLRSL